VSPSAPQRGAAPRIDGANIDFGGLFSGRENEEVGAGFQLRMG
jgi:cell division cycle 2-like